MAEEAKLSPGQEKIEALKFGGFSDQEIKDWQGETTKALSDGGFTPQEIKEYFGDKDPDTTAMKTYVADNFKKEAGDSAQGQPKEAKTFFDAFMAGTQLSTAGLAIRGEMPNVVLPEHSTRAMNIANMVGTLVGDIPAMAAGGFLGGVAGAGVGAVEGSIVPGLGTLAGVSTGLTIGTGAGAFALPAALRKIMMDHYEKGDIKSPGDFLDRLSATTWETMKQAVVGGATFGVGKAAGLGAQALGAGQRVQALSQVSSEIATMTTVGAAVEGHLPRPDDFINASLLMGGMHAIGSGSTKLRQIYRDRGTMPGEVLEMAKSDPILRTEVLSDVKPEILGEKIEVKNEQTSFSTLNGEKISETLSFPADTVKVEPIKAGEVKLFNDKIERSTAEMEVLSRVGEQAITKEGLGFKEIYTAMIDDLNPINEVVKGIAEKGKIDIEKDPYVAGRLYRGWHGKFERATKYGTFDFKTGAKETGEGLATILKDVPKQDKDGFTAYGIAKRALEKEGQGVKTGIPIEAAKEVVKNGKQFEDTFKRLNEFQNRMMDYAVDSGLLSETSAKQMKELNKDYFPFHRIMDLDPLTGKSGTGSLFKAMKGSERQLVDPITTIYKNTASIIKAAERNRVYESLVKLSEENTSNVEFVRPAKRQIKPIEVKDTEVAKILDKLGVDESVSAEPFMIFRPKDHILQNNEFVLYRDGKAKIYQTTPELSESLKALDAHSGLTKNWLTTFMTLPAKTLRFGVTATPDFITRNFFRDQITASTQGKFGQLPFVDAIQSIGHMFKKDKLWQDYLSSGGASGGFGEVARYIEQDVWKLNKETGFINATFNVVKSPIQSIGVVSELIEALPRFTEFRKAGGGLKGAMSAREVTVDFARSGAKIRAVNAMTFVMNAGIQGLDQTVRAFKERPVEVFARGTAMITMPTILLWWANKDDSRYKDAPSWQKDLFWLVPTDKWEKAANLQDAMNRPEDLRRERNGTWEVNNGTVYRFPKPFEYGLVMGSMVERALNGFYNDNGSEAFRGFDDTLLNALEPNLIPTVALPFVEQRFNKSFFTQKPIVPNHLEAVNPEYQYTNYTSETAKQLGKLIGYVPGIRDIGPKEAKLSSPVVVDNYIRSWGGTLGQFAIDIADKGLTATGIAETKGEKPTETLADIHFIKAFVMRHPTMQMEPIQEFYDSYNQSEKIRASVKKLVKEGKFDEAQELTNNHMDEMVDLDGIRKTLYNHNILIQKINESKDYSRDDKRQLIDGLYYRMSEVARAGNKIIKQLKEKK